MTAELDLGLAARVIAGVRTRTASEHGCPTWDTPGVAAALTATGGDPGMVLAAAALAASDPALRLPSAAAFRAHWPVNAPTGPPAPPNRVRCHEHPEQVMPCQQCRTENPPASPETVKAALDAARAAIRANPSPAPRERKPLGTTEGAP